MEQGAVAFERYPSAVPRERESAETAASAHLGRRADSEAQLDVLLGARPLSVWMQITVTPLEPHPNDPTSTRGLFSSQRRLAEPQPGNQKHAPPGWLSPRPPHACGASFIVCRPARG
jgi:hypothetical protein